MIRTALLSVALLIICTGAGCPPKPTPQDLGPPRDLAAIGDLAVPAGVGACPIGMPLPVATDVCDGLFTAEGFACVRCEAGGCMDTVDKMYCVMDSCSSDKRCAAPAHLHKSQIKKARAGGK